MALPLPSRPPRHLLPISPNPNRSPLLPPYSTVLLRVDGRRRSRRIQSIEGAADLSSPPPEVTWQIAVGALAGVTPFVVAGVEFGKRIAEQRKCDVCGGSGLVLMEDKQYVRCPGCGGFLPWQSWKRFFTG